VDYRSRIYEKYATHVHRRSEPVSLADADRWGATYDTYMRGWLPARKDAGILDVACGYGRLLRFFARRGYTDVTGIDISPEQVELARQVHANVIQTNALEYLESNLRRFDLITAFDLIEHLHKDEVIRFLDACHGALRPGGRLVLQTPNGDSPCGTMHRYNDFTHEVCFNPNALSWVMGLCGFKSFEARECGPVPHGVISAIRYVLWQALRLKILAELMIETGSSANRVTTRVFIASGVKA
jgi:2-polyprenyl-3-methyl-5-hydroxy-6-metoxy-1,4-benzoquinol methylase